MDSQSSHQNMTDQFAKVLKMLESSDQGDTHVASIVASSRELLNVGEEGIAFENIVENLYEIDFALNKELYG